MSNLEGIRQTPNVTILIMWSSSGYQSWGMSEDITSAYWQKHLDEMLKNDRSWPFRATIELIDVVSNSTLVKDLLTDRLTDKTKSNVTVILGPESSMGFVSAPIAESFGIAHILTSTNPSASDPKPPNGTSTSFFIEAPAQYTFRAMIHEFSGAGIKSLAVVALEPVNGETYDYDSCIYTARDIAAPKGITTYEFTYPTTATADDVMSIVKKIQAINPDAVFWCDWPSQAYEETFHRFPLTKFKEINYLPKAFSMLDIFDSTNFTYDILQQSGYLDFVGAGQFINNDCHGEEYTQDDAPYSSVFRSSAPISTVYDQLTAGSTTASPSSVKLFHDWFVNETGNRPVYQVHGAWAAYDIIEAAIYQATQIDAFMDDGVLSAKEVLSQIYGAQTVGPYGRVIFDHNRVNTPTPSIFVQLYPGDALPTLVAPSQQSVKPFVYPMPSWDERTYKWSMVRSNGEMGSICMAAICSAIILIMMVTIIRHRNETAIRMLHYLHVTSICAAAIVICWALTLVWQEDMRQWQCDSYLWLTFLPASYIVNLVNMKAYRLSVFLHSTNAKRKQQYTHARIMNLALSCTAITATLLLIMVLVDRPISTRLQPKPYRPLYDYHKCTTKTSLSYGLQWLLVLGHLLSTLVCIAAVRNGTEMFRDGTLMKESFVILYALLAVTFIMHRLSLDNESLYLLRTLLLCFAVSLFLVRLLGSRVMVHVLPKRIRQALKKIDAIFHQKIHNFDGHGHGHGHGHQVLPVSKVEGVDEALSIMITNKDRRRRQGSGGDESSTRAADLVNNNQSTLQQSSSLLGISSAKASQLSDAPTYAASIPAEAEIQEMYAVLSNPKKASRFRDIAEKSLATENVDFIMAILAFKNKAKQVIIDKSIESDGVIVRLAEEVYLNFIKVSSPGEVNLSSLSRCSLEKKLLLWMSNERQPFLTDMLVTAILNEDPSQRIQLFDETFKEISVLLYQNLWHKFRAAEAAFQMAGENKSSSSVESDAASKPAHVVQYH